MRKVDPAKIVREIMKREAEDWEGQFVFTYTKGKGITNVREAYDIPIPNPMSFKECEDKFLEGFDDEQKAIIRKHYIGLQGYRAFGKVSTASMAHGKLTKLHVDRSISIEKFWES